MSYRNQEDWVHIDAYNEEVDSLQDKVSELTAVNQDMADDEVFILSELIELRWRYSDYSDMYQELEHIIRLHDKSVIEKAIEKLGQKFPSKQGVERWDL